MHVSVFVRTAAASAAAAVVGSLGTRVDSDWYRALGKPAWQPPGWVFGPAWTLLYAAIAVGSGRCLHRCDQAAIKRQFAGALAVNLSLNAGWSWLFFTARQPRIAEVESVLLTLSTLDLIRRAARIDTPAAVALAPYGAWVAFATALTGSIANRNRAGAPRRRHG